MFFFLSFIQMLRMLHVLIQIYYFHKAAPTFLSLTKSWFNYSK